MAGAFRNIVTLLSLGRACQLEEQSGGRGVGGSRVGGQLCPWLFPGPLLAHTGESLPGPSQHSKSL